MQCEASCGKLASLKQLNFFDDFFQKFLHASHKMSEFPKQKMKQIANPKNPSVFLIFRPETLFLKNKLFLNNKNPSP